MLIDFKKMNHLSQDSQIVQNIFAKWPSHTMSDGEYTNDNASKDESNFKHSPNFTSVLDRMVETRGY